MQKNGVCTHLEFMLGADGLREWRWEKVTRSEREDGWEGKGEEGRSKRKQEGKIGMLRRGVRCVTAVRERIEGSLLFSPSVLGGFDNNQTRPDSALASMSLALRHNFWSHTMLHTINLPHWRKEDE